MADTQAEAPQAPIRRMIIQRIVQENFKSYAGRVEIGPFHKVGPASDPIPHLPAETAAAHESDSPLEGAAA